MTGHMTPSSCLLFVNNHGVALYKHQNGKFQHLANESQNTQNKTITHIPDCSYNPQIDKTMLNFNREDENKNSPTLVRTRKTLQAAAHVLQVNHTLTKTDRFLDHIHKTF